MSRAKGKKAVNDLKKYIVLLLLTTALFSFCGCNVLTSNDSGNLEFHENAAYDSEITDGDNESFIFTWLSYIESAVTPEIKTEDAYRKYISTYFDNMKSIGVTDCFFQVRPFGDAMYKSDIFPESKYSKGATFDVLSAVCCVAEKYDIRLHAWINPYRLAEDTAEKDIMVTPSGKYFNPALKSVREKIIGGAKELMENYNLKGIHIDDYFYPPDMNSADEEQFRLYKEKGGELNLSQWRRENVNMLLRELYVAVKSYGEDKMFSVSPAGDINKNINQLYADVKLWCSEKGYCDVILPQIYFGFHNEHLPFEQTLSQWQEISEAGTIKLVPALALYKAGEEDMYAGMKGKTEWQKNSDIISRQVKCLKKKNISSFGLYSASYINFSKTFLSQELNNLKNVI